MQGDGVAEDARIEGSMLVVTSHQGEELAGLGARRRQAALRGEGGAGRLARSCSRSSTSRRWPPAPTCGCSMFRSRSTPAAGARCASTAPASRRRRSCWPTCGTRAPAVACRRLATQRRRSPCRDAALAKCVEWGYKPWTRRSARGSTRPARALVRADYCGDGVAHTQPGTADSRPRPARHPGRRSEPSIRGRGRVGPDGAVCLNANNMRLGPQAIELRAARLRPPLRLRRAPPERKDRGRPVELARMSETSARSRASSALFGGCASSARAPWAWSSRATTRGSSARWR